MELWIRVGFSPATAKNVIAVGSSESERPDKGFIGLSGYFKHWGDVTDEQGNMIFPTNPIRDDLMSDRREGMEGMAAFSGRGPVYGIGSSRIWLPRE